MNKIRCEIFKTSYWKTATYGIYILCKLWVKSGISLLLVFVGWKHKSVIWRKVLLGWFYRLQRSLCLTSITTWVAELKNALITHKGAVIKFFEVRILWLNYLGGDSESAGRWRTSNDEFTSAWFTFSKNQGKMDKLNICTVVSGLAQWACRHEFWLLSPEMHSAVTKNPHHVYYI